LGSQGLSIQGSIPSTIQKNIILRSSVVEVIIIPDAGYYLNGLQTAQEFLINRDGFVNVKKIKVLNLNPFKEEGKGKDVNEIGIKSIFELYNNTQYMDIGYLYREKRKHA
jgi:hypothetical protein